MSDDKYINVAINALYDLQEKTNTDTKNIISILDQMNDWEDVKTDKECCTMILRAFEELEKNDFDECSHMMRGHYRSMMDDLRHWIAPEQDEKMTEEDFVKEFGCDRETYDRILCENERRILEAREEKVNEKSKWH